MELSKDDDFLNYVAIVFDPDKDIKTRNAAKENIKASLLRQLIKCIEHYSDECHDNLIEMLTDIDNAMILNYDARNNKIIQSFVFDGVFEQLAVEVKGALSKGSKGHVINADHYKLYTSLLNLPSEVFEDEWNGILDAQGIPHTKKTIIAKKESISPGFQVEPKPKGTVPIKRAPIPTELARPVIGPFALNESYSKDFSRTWAPQWNSEMLLFEPRDKGIADKWLIKSFFDIRTYMTGTIFEKNPPILDDLIIMIQEIQFWITSFFSDILTPCTLRAPTAVRSVLFKDTNMVKYRDGVMLPLMKLYFIFTIFRDKKKMLNQQDESRIAYVNTPFLTSDQWEQYLSLQFPAIANQIFPDNEREPQISIDLSNEYKNLYRNSGEVVEFLKFVQTNFIKKQPVQKQLVKTVPVASFERETKPLPVEQQGDVDFDRLKKMGQCLNDIDVDNFISLLNEKTPSKDHILLNSFATKSIKKNFNRFFGGGKKPKYFVFVRNVNYDTGALDESGVRHWIVIQVPTSGDNPIFVYDSLKHTKDDFYKNDVNEILQFLTNRKMEEPSLKDQYNVLEEEDVMMYNFIQDRLQQNNTSCGLFALIFLQAIATNKYNVLKEMTFGNLKDEREMRKFIMRELKDRQLLDLTNLIKK